MIRTLNGRLHGVQADPPAGDVRHLRGGAHAGPEEEGKHGLVVQGSHLVFPAKAARHRRLAHGRHIDAVAVVLHMNHRKILLPVGLHQDSSLLRLAGFSSRTRFLDAVIHRIPEKMDQRVVQGIHDGPVQLERSAANLEFNLLSTGPSDVSDHAGEGPEDPVEGR
jgi:hypothetical protein